MHRGVKIKTNEEDYVCKEEKLLSLKCLNQNDHDNDKCLDTFKNYEVCRKFWAFVSKKRNEAHVRPIMPLRAEREAIKKYYIATGDIPDFKKSWNFQEGTQASPK